MSTVLTAAPAGTVDAPKFRTACVIGAGFGGLALAIRLQSAGVQTTLIESRDKPGGRAYVFEDQGFVFDAGPTVITDPSCLEELWELSGRKLSDYVELLPVTPFYRLLWEDGTVFDYSNDDEALFAQIAAKSPRDVEGYKKFLEYSEGVFREGYEKLGHEAFLDFKSMLKAAPSLMKYQAFRSVYSIVAKYIKDDQLRQAFSFHSLLVGGNPFKTSSIYALIHALEKKWGVWFPRGGTNALVKGHGQAVRGPRRYGEDRQRRRAESPPKVRASPACAPRTAGAAASTPSPRTPTSSTPTRRCSASIRGARRWRAR